MNSFNRENRYIVIKHSDLDKLYKYPNKSAVTFGHALALIIPHLPKRQFLVIESDWPEYEPVWQMIERRVTGAAPVVERQPVAIVKKWFVDQWYVREGGNSGWHTGIEFKTDLPDGAKLYTAPPEIAELQATIVRLKAACAKEFESVQLLDNENQILKTTIERLKAGQEKSVSIILPDPLDPDFYGEFSYHDGWNACLDKIKELNPNLLDPKPSSV